MKNCLGLPVNMRLAWQKKFAKDVTYTQLWNLEADCKVRDKLEMPLSDSIKLTVQ